MILKSDKTLKADQAVVGVGVVPATEPFKDISGVNIDKRGYIPVDSKMTTSVSSYLCSRRHCQFPFAHLWRGMGHHWSLGAGHVPGEGGCSQYHGQGERCSHCPFLLDCPVWTEECRAGVLTMKGMLQVVTVRAMVTG